MSSWISAAKGVDWCPRVASSGYTTPARDPQVCHLHNRNNKDESQFVAITYNLRKKIVRVYGTQEVFNALGSHREDKSWRKTKPNSR